MPIDDITGFVLAGGQSRRMKQDKAQIPWGKGTLLAHAYQRLQQVASKVFVVGGHPASDDGIPVLPDAFPGLGPLAGIYSALLHAETNWNLVLAVDLPLVTVNLLKFVADLSKATSTLAVALRIGARIEPLCALYNRKLFPEIEQRVQSGELSIHHLLESVSTRIIEEREFLAAGFSIDMLFNVNTPQDLEPARILAKTLHV
jgi:molybdopterin-guanine dinucleotide biosynthesis protein A